MKIFRSRRQLWFLCAAFLLTLAGIFSIRYGSDFLFNKRQDFKIIAKNINPGTIVSYEVFAKGKRLDGGKTLITDQSEVSLKLPDMVDKTIKNAELIYTLEMEKAQVDQMMNVHDPVRLVLGVNPETKSVSFEGSGFKEFSDILITSGDQTKVSKSDWSGNFQESATIIDKNLQNKANEAVKFAFQSMNLGSDVDVFNPNGSIEVFFGDSNGSSTGAVQARYSRALIMMTEQLSAVMMQQALIIGTFLDAKMQLETQRKFHELYARAHKDYHPSDQMCRFGTFVRSVANTESNAENNKRAINRFLIDQYTGVQNAHSSLDVGVSSKVRVANFVANHCDPHDNNGGLVLLCPGMIGPTTPAQRERFNKDVDYTRTVDNRLTIDMNFSDTTLTGDENDVLTMAQNLYFPQPFGETKAESLAYDLRGHYASRTFAAKMGVAHNSFVNIVGMKSSAPAGTATAAPPPAPPVQITNTRGPIPPATNYAEDAGWTYMKSMLREFGILDQNGSGSTDDEIHALLGNRPSYYAQMEVLTKKIYQNPDFFTNLYDKPANVERIGVAMDAIMIMNQRDRYDSQVRREMITSLLVEEGLAPEVEDVNARIFSAMQQTQKRTRP